MYSEKLIKDANQWHTTVAQAIERAEDKPSNPFLQGLWLGLSLGFVLGICVLGLVITS